MAEKEVKTKRRTLADAAEELQESKPYTNKIIKAKAKKIAKYVKENPKDVAILAAETFFPYGKVWKGLKSGAKSLRGRKRAPAKMKKGGPVKKCKVDGVAKRGFTKAYSMKKGK